MTPYDAQASSAFSALIISPETLTSYFDVVLNKGYAGQGAVFCVRLFPCKDSMSLTVRKWCLRLNVIFSNTIERLTYLSTLTSA